ncbi:DUF2171 domain-containing protein [Tengunoibacter tsumagoiensis]|uniref:DUF2171 domain-containing protein n=1 Tax=Tengunoibacter tsumagoiensis TaxID=2014871 RepID=A0A402A1H1_9CHLR|nr:DUF2171 domain-containing protein [Tengunoibacter tsumagoiensis]GCE13010.1 hypothetical protein KTT_28690 [Tengunoibacter tsumagoiensis]
MTHWTPKNLRKHQHVYTSDEQNLGQVNAIYEDSFVVHKGVFARHRYFPYSVIARMENDTIHLSLNADEAAQMKWEKRPDYEDHLGDPTQLFYDRGHGVVDPFDETASNQS